MNADLGIGYDVLYLQGSSPTIHRLCDLTPKEESAPTKIWAPGLDTETLARPPRKKIRTELPPLIQNDQVGNKHSSGEHCDKAED